MKKFTIKKAFENQSFVNCINKLYAQQLKDQDEWGGTNLSGYIEFLAESESDCCGIPSIAFKRYLENEDEDWKTSIENRESDQCLNQIYELIEEKEDDLYESMASDNDWDFLSDDIEKAASELSRMLSSDNKDHTDEWIDHLENACKGVQFNLA